MVHEAFDFWVYQMICGLVILACLSPVIAVVVWALVKHGDKIRTWLDR